MAYLVAMVVLFVVVAGADVVYQRQTATAGARRAAFASAGFGARTAAREVGAALAAVRAQVAALAANPGIRQAFGAPASCTLQFGGAGPFTTGHIDIVRANGTVACSSLHTAPARGYAGASWLAGARRGPSLTGPLTDPRTGQRAVAVTAPVPGQGAVAAFLNLAPAGPVLASTLAGAQHLEFVITTANGATVLARSIDAAAWAGKPVAGTPFAGAAGLAEHSDLTGTPRLYGEARVAGAGWRVFAGEATARAFAVANQLSDHQIAIVLAGLALFLLSALVLRRRIATPIARLSAGVRAAAEHLTTAPITVTGPAEVTALAGDFSRLVTAASRELEARSRLAAIADSSADAIMGCSLDGVVTSWNAGAERMFGYSRQEMVGASLSVLAEPGREEALRTVLETVRAGLRVVEAEARFLRKDRSIVELSYTVAPVRDASGAVTGAAAVARDITERNRALAQRRALEQRLRQAERLESLGQLAGGIAHDFNNLLAVIANYAGFVAQQTAGQPGVAADIEEIRAAAERGARLTRQLLVFGRREASQREPLDLNAVMAGMQNLLSHTIGSHIRLAVHPGPGLPAIEADRAQIEQVLLNLAINARDAMPAGGTLTMQTRLAELGDTDAGLEPGITAGRHVELAVSDTGSGMSPDVAVRIFEPFFTTKPAGRGTGLGLSTVYGIVTQAGGSLKVESTEGAGTTVRLYFPASPAPAASGPGPAVPPAPGMAGRGETILVVDDEPAVLSAASRILRQHGYATLEAATFDTAVGLASSHDVQLLLTDSLLPTVSGQTLADRLTSLRPGLAVLYMSGFGAAAPGDRRDGAGVLQKPFTPQALLDAVNLTLTSRAAGSPGSS